MEDPILVDARQLSSGTIGHLIGSPRYDDIDRRQREFVEFVSARPHQFETWQDAWIDFEDHVLDVSQSRGSD